MNIRSIATLAKVLHTVTSFGSSVKCHDVYMVISVILRNSYMLGDHRHCMNTYLLVDFRMGSLICVARS